MTAIRVPARPGVTDAVRDSLTVGWRNMLVQIRTPATLLFSTLQPVLFVLTFKYVFGDSIIVPTRNYVDYLMPGVFVLAVAFGAINTGVGLATDLQTGLIERFRSLPMARGAVLAGRILADVARNVVVILIMVGLGYLIGFRFHAGVVSFLGSLGLALLFGIPICWVLAYIGLLLRNAEGVGAAAFPLMGALVFISSAFVATERMPGPVRVYADHQPVTVVVDAVRALALGGASAGQVLAALAWIGGLTVVFAALSIKQFNRSAA